MTNLTLIEGEGRRNDYVPLELAEAMPDRDWRGMASVKLFRLSMHAFYATQFAAQMGDDERRAELSLVYREITGVLKERGEI